MFKVILTADGTPTIIDDRHNSTYHSEHGSVQESLHVFIKEGLHRFLSRSELSILEIGFGTGLNALLTIPYVEHHCIQTQYTSYELYPLDTKTLSILDYSQNVPGLEYDTVFENLHRNEDGTTEISEYFSLERRKMSFTRLNDMDAYDLIYMDAFGPGTQEQFWRKPFLAQLYSSLRPGGM